jgi:hypothetical protein
MRPSDTISDTQREGARERESERGREGKSRERESIHSSSYYYIRVHILLYMCPHTTGQQHRVSKTFNTIKNPTKAIQTRPTQASMSASSKACQQLVKHVCTSMPVVNRIFSRISYFLNTKIREFFSLTEGCCDAVPRTTTRKR